VVVKNSRNEEIRKCCTYHGNRLARKLNDEEAKKTPATPVTKDAGSGGNDN
jgi:hypothetical protein